MGSPTKRKPRKVSPRLSQRQAQAQEELEEAFKDLKPWHGAPFDQQKWKRELMETRLLEYEETVIAAIRAGLEDHALVKMWIEGRRVLGERDVLRSAKRGLETSVKRPMKEKDLRIWASIKELRDAGKSWESIRRILINRGDLPRMTRQAFHMLLARLDRI